MSCCGETSKLPPAGQMAVRAASAAFRVASAVASGHRVHVTPETLDTRKAGCYGNGVEIKRCDHCLDFPKGETIYHRCALCGCWLDGKFFAKLHLSTERCPLGRWEPE